MTTKKLEQSRSWQPLELRDAKAIYNEEFQLGQHTHFLNTFERIAYPSRAAGYDHISKGVAIIGRLIADRNVNVALIAEKVRERPEINQGAGFSLAMFLEAESANNGMETGRRHPNASSLFNDVEDAANGKRIRLEGPCPLDREFAGEAAGATVRCMFKAPSVGADSQISVDAIVNDPLLEEVTMMLRRQLHDQMITLRK
ncbi:MAG: hypothetical protein KGH60_00835 [Candidatus Micrarchaeota archaeon]|nr:hypothetical protein [Candidatus Micrarchaeota archaeon]